MNVKLLGWMIGLVFICLTGSVSASDNFIQKKSNYGVGETLDRLESILKKKGITVFARVDHGAGAKKAGLQMSDTQLLIFGNPKMGTPLMKEQRLMGLDLPMKVLAWEGDNGQTWVAYTNPEQLKRRHGLKNQMLIDKMSNALHGMTEAATSK